MLAKTINRLGLQHAVAFFVLVLAGVLLCAPLQHSQSMTEDFAVYLQEAINIVSGVSLQKMGVVYAVDPQAALISQAPLFYPPLVPALYAPVVAVLGLHFTALKLTQIALLLGAFALILAFRRRLGLSLFEACITILVFTLHPGTPPEVNNIGSDLPFLTFLVLTLLAMEAQLSAPPERRLTTGLLLGVATFLAVNARVVAVAALPAAVLANIVRHGRKTPAVNIVVPGIAFTVMWLAQSALIGRSNYDFVFTHRFFDVFGNLHAFYWQTLRYWNGNALEGPVTAIVVVAVLLSAIGVVDGVRRGEALPWFSVTYLGILLILPNFDAGPRYLIPLLLFFGAFAMRGCRVAAALMRLGDRVSLAGGATIATLLLIAWVLAPRSTAVDPTNALGPQSTAVFDYLRTHTPPDALIAAPKYRAFHLFTGRRTIRPFPSHLRSAGVLSDWLRSNGVDYVVVKLTPSQIGANYSDCPASPSCRKALPETDLVFENANFRVFHVRTLQGVGPASD